MVQSEHTGIFAVWTIDAGVAKGSISCAHVYMYILKCDTKEGT